MLALRLPTDLEKRLERLAKRTGRTKTYYAREAIIERLDDLERIYLTEQAHVRSRKNKQRSSRAAAGASRSRGARDRNS